MLNMSVARSNMIKQQVKTWDVDSPSVINLFASIPREHFLPEPLHKLAYTDCMLPIGHGQVCLPSKELARALQALNIQKHEQILEIGTGSSYSTALLAELGKYVHSIDIYEDFISHARAQLSLLGIENVKLEIADGARGFNSSTEYNIIISTGSFPILPKSYQQQLAIGGRMFAIIGTAPVMRACLFTRTRPEHWECDILFETNIPALENVVMPSKFVF